MAHAISLDGVLTVTIGASVREFPTANLPANVRTHYLARGVWEAGKDGLAAKGDMSDADKMAEFARRYRAMQHGHLTLRDVGAGWPDFVAAFAQLAGIDESDAERRLMGATAEKRESIRTRPDMQAKIAEIYAARMARHLPDGDSPAGGLLAMLD